MRLLVIGGTIFLGRYIVEHALANGHEVTLFNRGQHNAQLFPSIEKIRGDRNGDLSALRGRAFDAVIDTCGYKPEQMRRMAEALGTDVAHYVFISSVSAYGNRAPRIDYDETAPLVAGDVGYGEEKARAEEAITAAYPNRVTIVRPGLIVGPHDPTGRFVYWPLRASLGGDMLVPGRPERPVQWIDVRDLAEWIVHIVENNVVGAFNAITPHDRYTMGELIAACIQTAKAETQPHWIDDQTLVDANVGMWIELPLWIAEDDAESGGTLLARADSAVAAGLRFRDVEVTASDTLAWAHTLASDDMQLGIGKTLTPTRERELLEHFKRL
jgi:2'-hydroxyisoflavone reductase